jgi:hypothetical protein
MLSTTASSAIGQSWQDLSPRQRYDALQNYRSYERQPEDKRRRVDEDYQRWQQMPPQEQERVRRNFERYQQMPPNEQQRLERKYEKWKRKGDAER